MDTQEKTIRRTRRRNRIRAKVSGTAVRPRLAIFRSNTRLNAQVINDEAQITIASTSTTAQKGATTRERAVAAGTALAAALVAQKITSVVFDRGGYMYTGNIAAFADAVRAGGIEF